MRPIEYGCLLTLHQCNQDQPCNHCRRRFPPPLCDYGPRRSNPPTFVAEQIHLRPDAKTYGSRQVPRWEKREDSRVISTKKTLARTGPVLGLDGIVYQCQLSGPVQSITHLPIQPTKQNAMLLHTFPELLYHFKGSFDGRPDPDNPFLTHYVPWCIQSPLLLATSLYIAARSLAERGFVDQGATMRAKGLAIARLNEQLRSSPGDDDDGYCSVSDEAMGGVVQFISIEWFFGEPDVVQAHLKGLREMVRLRGGFPWKGVGVLVTKVALVDDRAVALWLERRPIMDKCPDFDFDHREPPADHFKVRYNSPLGPSTVAFASCEEVLGLHPATAAILDDLRFMIGLVLGLPPDATPEQLRKVRATARWIHDRIARLNREVPGGPMESVEGDDETASARARESLSPETDVKPHSLLPDYPAYNSSPRSTPSDVFDGTGSNSSTSPNTARSSSTGSGKDVHTTAAARQQPDTTHDTQTPEPLYTGVRLAATIYARAIATRRPLSHTCLPSEALALLSATWRIPLARWRGVIGVLLALLVGIMPTMRAVEYPSSSDEQVRDAGEAVAAAHLRHHCGFVKSILQIGLMQMAVEDWGLCAETMARALALQRWLGGKG